MTEAGTLLQTYERASDEERRKVVYAKWNAFRNFFAKMEKEGTFWDIMNSTPDRSQIILQAHNNPIGFPGPIIFTGPTGGGQTGGFGYTKDGRPALIFHFNGNQADRFGELFPKYCGSWVSSLGNSFAHEYTHYLDSLLKKQNSGRKELGSARFSDAGDMSGYYNHPAEINAYFTELRQEKWDWVRILRDTDLDKAATQRAFNFHLGETFNVFAQQIAKNHWFETLTPQNKQRVLKRAYTVWNELWAEAKKVVSNARESEQSEPTKPRTAASGLLRAIAR